MKRRLHCSRRLLHCLASGGWMCSRTWILLLPVVRRVTTTKEHEVFSCMVHLSAELQLQPKTQQQHGSLQAWGLNRSDRISAVQCRPAGLHIRSMRGKANCPFSLSPSVWRKWIYESNNVCGAKVHARKDPMLQPGGVVVKHSCLNQELRQPVVVEHIATCWHYQVAQPRQIAANKSVTTHHYKKRGVALIDQRAFTFIHSLQAS